jgi:hypothetical protein
MQFGSFHIGWLPVEPTHRKQLKLLRQIMATQADIINDLKETKARQLKTAGEIAALQVTATALNSKIVELEAIIAQGGTISQELADIVAEVKGLAVTVDEQIPDLPVPEPTPEQA